MLFKHSLPDLQWLEKEFAKRGPWVTNFTIGGKAYGGGISFDNDNRIRYFFDNFPKVRSILDLGSLEGGQTFQLAKHPKVTILGIEGRQVNIEKAEFVSKILGIKRVKFVLADLEKNDLTPFGRFDAVFCSGLLYHMPEPWELIEKISKVTSNLFIWTHYVSDEKADQLINGYRGWWYSEFGLQDPQSGMSSKSYWLTLESLLEMLRRYKFATLKVLDDNPHHPHGPCVTLAAWADKDAKSRELFPAAA